MEWLMAFYIIVITAYANMITKKHTEVEKDRDYWRKKAIRLNADVLRLEVKLNGDSEEKISL